MSPRSTPPFRADHVGSLLRPPGLHEARRRHAEGAIGAAELRAVEDDAIRAVVAMQRDVGLESATDGELRRSSWHMDFIYQLRGITRSSEAMAIHFRNAAGELEFTPAALRVEGKLGLDHTIFGEDFAFLQSITAGVTPKLTIPSPSMVHYRGGRASVDASVYPDMDEFWDDLSAAYADEIAALGRMGCSYLQLDDTSLPT